MFKLQACDLCKSYRGRKVVDALGLEVGQGEVVGLLGPNGAGKTTTFYILVGLARPDSGRVLLDGEDITDLPMYLRARSGISYLPQEPSAFRQLTVEENLLVAARPGDWSAARVYDLFPSLGARRKNRGNHLSGGEQQMLAIGRALMGNPALLLMDEPLEGLAPVIVDTLLAALAKLKTDGRLSLMLVEQHARLALEFAENAIVLDRGAIVFSGQSRELLDAPQRLDALMGVAARAAR